MYISQAIISMIIFMVVGTVISYGIFLFVHATLKVSGLKVMLLGLGIIAFSNAVLKGMVRGDADTTITIIGFSILLSGFFIKDK
ncbi:MAG TPA: hypothetical protein VHT34_13525 [Clostridia bacterium]|nr:hypothetical protein [Clostridia bacterium]